MTISKKIKLCTAILKSRRFFILVVLGADSFEIPQPSSFQLFSLLTFQSSSTLSFHSKGSTYDRDG